MTKRLPPKLQVRFRLCLPRSSLVWGIVSLDSIFFSHRPNQLSAKMRTMRNSRTHRHGLLLWPFLATQYWVHSAGCVIFFGISVWRKRKLLTIPIPKYGSTLFYVESSTRTMPLCSVLCHSTKVMNASIHVICTREYVTFSISRLPVWLVPKFKWWNVSPTISIGRFSKRGDAHGAPWPGRLVLRFSGRQLPSINLGSYNYLGFAETQGPCSDQAIKSIDKYGVSTCSTRYELGTQKYMKDLESLMATYLNVEDCIAFGMGFATNALNIPSLAGKVVELFLLLLCLHTSDSLLLGRLNTQRQAESCLADTRCSTVWSNNSNV